MLFDPGEEIVMVGLLNRSISRNMQLVTSLGRWATCAAILSPYRNRQSQALAGAFCAITCDQSCFQGRLVDPVENQEGEQYIASRQQGTSYKSGNRRMFSAYNGSHVFKDIGGRQQSRDGLHPAWQCRDRIEDPGKGRKQCGNRPDEPFRCRPETQYQ